MSGKRKRGREIPVTVPSSGTPITNGKPISAVAAARLRVAATQDPVIEEPKETTMPTTSSADPTESDCAESEPEEPIPLVSQNFKLCTWRNVGTNVLSDTDKELTITIEKNSTVSFIGYFDIKVLKGAININGANLGAIPRQGENARAHRVFVPSTHPITKIRGLDRTNDVQFLSCEGPTPFANINPLFANIWAAGSTGGKPRSFGLIIESSMDPLSRPLTPEITPEDHLRTIEEITTKSIPYITLVIGPASSGKSTYTKRLLNRYLTGLGKTVAPVPEICYLDLDAERPEYTTNGQISLTIVREFSLGPAFTHPATVPEVEGSNETVSAYPVSAQGLANYEEYFTSCVSSLLSTFRSIASSNSTLPLIINTPASLYAQHFQLLSSLFAILRPNYIIHLGNIMSMGPEMAEKRRIIRTLSSKLNTTLYELAPQFPLLPPSRTNSELRSMQMQSYFHLSDLKPTNKPSKTLEYTWDKRPLTTLTPWEFCYQETPSRTQDFLGFLPLFDPLPSTHLFTALNASIVHILKTSDTETQALFCTLPRTPKHQIPYFPPNPQTHVTEPLAPQSSNLICTALIRGFDPENRIVQLLVPKSHDSLVRALTPETTVLVAGCCETPEWAYTEDAYQQLHARKANLDTAKRFVGEDILVEDIEAAPWVERKSVMDSMGYMNSVRRVRKFLG